MEDVGIVSRNANDDCWFTDGNKQPCEKSQSMTENKEAVVCTEPRRDRGEMANREYSSGPVGVGGVEVVSFRRLFLGLFQCLPLQNARTPNTPRPSTRTECTDDRSTQSNSELNIGSVVKRTHQMAKYQSEWDSVESNRFQQDAYIQIPLSVMSGNESTSNKNQLIFNEDESPSSPVEVQNGKINYKLIEGFPSCADIRKRKSYVMSYNTETKNAEWVYEILNKSTLDKKCKENISFGKNELENKDYQQGHLAAAANHTWCQEAYHDTYLMSNMIPQLSALNQKMWKILENHCRELVEPDCNVHVYTGPLYLKRKKDDYVRVLDPKNPNNSEEKAKPTHLFKVIIVEKNGRVEEPKCYVMPNKKLEYKKTTEDKELDDFIKNIEYIQKLSGLKFKIDKPQHNMIDHIEKITWKGEDGKGESCEVIIEVKILKNPQNSSHKPHSDNKDANV